MVNMMMDTTLYDELSLRCPPTTTKMKAPMLFNLPKEMRQGLDGILSSVELGLSTPELDRFLIHTDDDTMRTLRSKDVVQCSQVLFDNDNLVTEEQEAYARGFVDALEELHKRKGPPLAPNVTLNDDREVDDVGPQNSMSEFHYHLPCPNYPSSRTHHTSTIHHVAGANQIYSLPCQQEDEKPLLSAEYIINNVVPMTGYGFEQQSPEVTTVKEEPQMVPRLGSTPPLSLIDMDEQEEMKLERKRARNRMAARKCRSRKLEQISVLEVRVAELKEQNSGLSRASLSLQEQVIFLRRELDDHVNTVCRLSEPLSYDFSTNSSQDILFSS